MDRENSPATARQNREIARTYMADQFSMAYSYGRLLLAQYALKPVIQLQYGKSNLVAC